MFENEQEFINKYCNFCVDNNVKIKSVGIAQAMIETGHFKDRLSQVYHNCFGIKLHQSDYVINGVNMETQEFTNGNYENTQAYFSVYKKLEDCFADYFDIVGARNINTVDEYLHKLESMGYATSPDYINLIRQVISDYNLSEYDTPANTDLFDAELYEFLSTKTKYEFLLSKLAHRTINGDFGNGEERQRRLGIAYNDVQNLVNELLS